MINLSQRSTGVQYRSSTPRLIYLLTHHSGLITKGPKQSSKAQSFPPTSNIPNPLTRSTTLLLRSLLPFPIRLALLPLHALLHLRLQLGLNQLLLLGTVGFVSGVDDVRPVDLLGVALGFAAGAGWGFGVHVEGGKGGAGGGGFDGGAGGGFAGFGFAGAGAACVGGRDA
jgi:hypothetical protein